MRLEGCYKLEGSGQYWKHLEGCDKLEESGGYWEASGRSCKHFGAPVNIDKK